MSSEDSEIINRVIKGELTYSPESYAGAHGGSPAQRETGALKKEKPPEKPPAKGN